MAKKKVSKKLQRSRAATKSMLDMFYKNFYPKLYKKHYLDRGKTR